MKNCILIALVLAVALGLAFAQAPNPQAPTTPAKATLELAPGTRKR